MKAGWARSIFSCATSMERQLQGSDLRHLQAIPISRRRPPATRSAASRAAVAMLASDNAPAIERARRKIPNVRRGAVTHRQIEHLVEIAIV